MYIRYFWQGNYEIYSQIRCIYTVLANPINMCIYRCICVCVCVQTHNASSPLCPVPPLYVLTGLAVSRHPFPSALITLPHCTPHIPAALPIVVLATNQFLFFITLPHCTPYIPAALPIAILATNQILFFITLPQMLTIYIPATLPIVVLATK